MSTSQSTQLYRQYPPLVPLVVDVQALAQQFDAPPTESNFNGANESNDREKGQFVKILGATLSVDGKIPPVINEGR
jgi:hypothetical protein